MITGLETINLNKLMKDTFVTITNHLKEFKYIDVAFHEAKFHESIVSYLYFVRINGDLQKSITKCIEMFEQRITYKKKFSQVLRRSEEHTSELKSRGHLVCCLLL